MHRSVATHARETSEYALIWPSETQQTLYVQAKRVEWASEQADLVLDPEDASDESFLASLHPSSDTIIVGCGHQVGLCNTVENRFVFDGLKKQFHLKFAIRRADFIPSLEVSLGSTSADRLAELRARRILLNENPAVESRDINVITKELFLGGMDSLVRVGKSPFPTLFEKFGSVPDRFLQIAWINAIVLLKLSGCVAQVTRLKLTLREASLDVLFSGRRKKQFQNKPPYEIHVEGSCPLVA